MPAPTTSQVFVRSVRQAVLAAGLGGKRVVAGCSGGPDSTALLLGLCAVQGELDLSLLAVYVDHGLRPEARAEGEAVRALAADLEVPAEVVAVSVPPGPALQAEARARRYAALGEVARRTGAAAVTVGHTASDQAETMLMRWLGGAGLRGLCGMAPRRPLESAPVSSGPPGPGPEGPAEEEIALVRPLLGLSRAQVLLFLEDAGITTVQDPSNADPRFLRARLRHDVLPLLRRERPDLDAHLADLSAQLRADADYLDELALQAQVRLQAGGPPGALPAAALAALPVPVAARVIAQVAGPLSHRHILAVLDLCRSTQGTRWLDLPDRRRAERRYDWLHFTEQPAEGTGTAEPGARPVTEVLITGPGLYRLGPVEVEIRLAPPPPPGGEAVCFDAAQVGFPLTLRHPRPGDRIRRPGAGSRKISDLLIDEKVPRPQRPATVLLCRGDEVLWVVGRRAGRARPPDFGPPAEPAWPPEVLVARRAGPGG